MLCDCRLQLCFQSVSLLFTPNSDLRVPFQMVIFLSPTLYDGFVPLCVVPSVRRGGGGWRETRGMGGLEWVSLRRCARCDFSTEYLLRQTQSRARHPLWLLGPQGTWGSSSTEYPGVRPRDRNCDLVVNPACDVQNGFVQFRGHESTQSGEYD